MATTLRLIDETDIEMVMNWRMSETVTRYMNTNPKLTMDKQKAWFASLDNNEKVRYWIIEVDGTPAGIINLADIDWEKGNTSWGYYIGEKNLRSLQLAISLEMSLYDYCFDILGFNEVHNEAFKLNEGVWKLHIACGCKVTKEVEGEIEKENIKYDIVHLSIERDEWFEIRPKKKYEKINYDIFQDKIGGMIPHHLGMAVANINKSIKDFWGLGWTWNGEIINDDVRNVKLAFLKRYDSNDLLELVSPMNDNSPVSNILTTMKNVATPYHICYEVEDIEKTIDILKNRKYILTDDVKPAVAFNNKRVAFLLNRDAGLVELVETKKNDI